MRISKRICSVVLAGTLACGLGIGSLALADSAAPNAAANQTVSEQLAQLRETQYSYTTFYDFGIQVQLPEGLLEVADVFEAEGMTSLEYADEKCGISIEFDAIGLDDETADLLVNSLASSFNEEFESAEAVVAGRTVDGNRLVDVIVYVAGEESDGSEAGAIIELTFLFTQDATATVMSYFSADDAETMFVLGQMHSSLAPSAYYGGAATAPATGSTTAPVTAPTTEPTGTTAPQTGTVAADGATVFELPGWDLAISADTDSMFLDTIPEDYWDDEVAGKSVIGVPITLTNTGTESANAWWDLDVTFYGPSGVAQDSGFSWVYDDDYVNLPDMRPGATADACFYVEDEGDGVYVIEVSAYDKNYDLVKYELEFELEHTA